MEPATMAIKNSLWHRSFNFCFRCAGGGVNRNDGGSGVTR